MVANYKLAKVRQVNIAPDFFKNNLIKARIFGDSAANCL
jgi:hypothetical protein